MDVGIYSYSHGDPLLIDKIVNEFLSQGKFDKLRKECMSDADTKPAYQNLQQRVENTVTQFLKKQVWRPDLNKNQLRDSLRKHILESGFFDAGINRIVDQVVNPNVLATVFLPEVEEVVYNYLSIPRPTDKNQKKCPADEKIKPPGSENDSQASQENGKCEKRGNNDHRGNELEEDNKPRDFLERNVSRVRDVRTPPAPVKTEPPGEEKGKRAEVQIKAECKIKSEPEEVNSEETQTGTPRRVEKMEVPSEESQDSLGRMGVDGLQLNEPEEVPAPDSDDSVPLEINEKSMSESRDSEDSIMNQMSPISQGRLTPDILEEEKEPKVEETSEEKKQVKEEERKPLTFIGRIPKLKREDSESSKPKDEKSPKEKLDVKNVYSSDESDSSKSCGKSDSDERKSKGKSEKPQTEERKSREEVERRRKHEDRRKSSKDRKRDEKSKERHSRDRKRERSRERHAVKKSSSSSSSSNARERSSSHRRSSHGRHKDSKDRSKKKEEEEEEKKKSKSADDHGKERNKKEDRRSTDRDSNERERDRSSGSRVQGESKRREREEKTSEGKESREKEAQAEDEGEPVGEHVPDSEEWAGQPQEECLDFGKLFLSGAIARLDFPKVADDFYVKFNSIGFKYFEDWEQSKLDCEEEFKEFVDEAESNLALISDDETDSENEFNFREENQRTVRNLLAGFGNFRRSLMFDPSTSDFYKWTSARSYQKFRKKGEKREKRSRERNESDESIKENIDKNKENREKENQALHLKLLSRYRRKALRLGKHRRRHRRPPESRGIKEMNENRSATEKHFLFEAKVRGAVETESFLGSVPIKTILECGLVETGSMEGGGEGTVDALTSLLREESRATVTLPESPDENEEWVDAHKATGLPPKCSLPLNLPLSPDSDDLSLNGVAPQDATINRKRPHKAGTDERGRAKRPTKRNWSQKYDSQDLYKPRPILNSSRSRGRERGLEPEIVNLESTVSRSGSLNGK